MSNMPIKAIALGLLDAEFIQEENTYRVKISFAKDLEDILSGLKKAGKPTGGCRVIPIN